MNPYRQQYLEDCRKCSPLIAFHIAIMRRIPKKYAKQVIALLRVYPDLAQSQILETTTAMLGIIWQCQPTEVPLLLQRMTGRSEGEITYSLGARQPGLGFPVRLEFTIPEAMEVQKC